MTEEAESCKLVNGPVKYSWYMPLQSAVIDRISQTPFNQSLESCVGAVKRILALKDKLNINSSFIHLSTLIKEGETECPVETDLQRQGKEQEGI